MVRVQTVCAAVIVIFLSMFCGSAFCEAGDADVTYYFGFDLRNSPDEDARQYAPFLAYLGKATGLRFKLRFTRKDESIVDLLGKGDVHFAAIGAGSYLSAHERYGVLPLVRGINAGGRAEYQSVIVVPVNSPIKRIADIRGKRFAFGSKTSTQGWIIPTIVLAEHGIFLKDLVYYDFTGSHRNVAYAVTTGKFDAGAMQDALGKELAGAGMLRILYTSKFYPSSGIAVNSTVPADIRQKVLRALLDFQPEGRDKKRLYNWDKTEMPKGFVMAKEQDYDELRQWAHRLGLFKKQE